MIAQNAGKIAALREIAIDTIIGKSTLTTINLIDSLQAAIVGRAAPQKPIKNKSISTILDVYLVLKYNAPPPNNSYKKQRNSKSKNEIISEINAFEQ
ncbi:hypothetical protein [Undibacterium crateris]|uniref:hypothetical protein n=1 Tax=Undibacterium crateris TaxID=2528175 RepID=UPI00138A12C6|nr:hypothetical protein [Undibacterium crateris]NDI87599.1 hypothetical protein [Undibacterium crateris]